MNAAVLKNIFSFADIGYLTGPILEKELLILSRRKRYYVLRTAYIIILALFSLVVFSIVTSSGSRVFVLSRMSEAGRIITVFVIFLQFIISQGLSVILLSTAISEEMHKRTLGILMTTPITSLQIVLGKLLSRPILLFLLLALALPLLAIIRFFGGITWDFLISSFFIILTSCLFSASVSLFFSIFTRSATQSMARTFLFLFIIYYILPLMQTLARFAWDINLHLEFLIYINPYYVLGNNIFSVFEPRFVFTMSWVLCSVVMTAASIFLLILSTIFVRRAALAQINGQAVIRLFQKGRSSASESPQAGSAQEGRILPVKGPPVMWKDTRLYLSSLTKLKSKIAFFLFSAILIFAYGYCFWEGVFDDDDAHMIFICLYLIVGLFSTATIAASSITGEREAKTWELLMTTPLTSSQIVLGKIGGSIIRNWPFLLLAFVHIVVFILLRRIHYAAFFLLAAVFIFSFYLASAAGVMISSLCKRTLWSSAITTAVFLVTMVPCCMPLGFLGSPLVVTAGILSYTAGIDAASKNLTNLAEGDYFLGFGLQTEFLIALLYVAGLVAIYFLAGFISYLISKNNVRFRIY